MDCVPKTFHRDCQEKVLLAAKIKSLAFASGSATIKDQLNNMTHLGPLLKEAAVV